MVAGGALAGLHGAAVDALGGFAAGAHAGRAADSIDGGWAHPGEVGPWRPPRVGSGHGRRASFQSSAERLAQPAKEEGDAEAAGRLEAAVDHAKAVARAARVWTDRAAAAVDAARLEAMDGEVQDATESAAALLHRIPAAMRKVNEELREFYADKAALEELQRIGGVADPVMEHHVVEDLRRHAEGMLHEVRTATSLGRKTAALTEAVERQHALARPVLRDTDVHMVPTNEAEGAPGEDDEDGGGVEGAEEEGEGGDLDAEVTRMISEADAGEPLGPTAAGCACDPQVKCGLQGRSFSWCRVGGGTCALLRRDHADVLDLGGADHNLYKGQSVIPASGAFPERSGAVWDYCTPKPGPKIAGSAPRTAHGGSCAWRGDLLRRYEEDPRYLGAGGKLDLQKVPMRDRPAVQIMLQYRADPDGPAGLCGVTPGSRPFAVCPAVADPERPELGSRGWLASRSWDFCTQRGWRPAHVNGQERSEVQPAPPAPSLPERAETPAEEEREGALGELQRDVPYPRAPEQPDGAGEPPAPVAASAPAAALPLEPPRRRQPHGKSRRPRAVVAARAGAACRLAAFLPELPACRVLRGAEVFSAVHAA